MSRAIPKQASIWDHRRNTSAVYGPLPDALPNAMRALAAFRRSDPALVRWIEDGHPLLSHDEHLARFGEPFKARPRRVA